jgi:hypothetical protein
VKREKKLFGPLDWVQATLIGLKLAGEIDWPWLQVLAPWLVVAGFVVLIHFSHGFLKGFTEAYEKERRS